MLRVNPITNTGCKKPEYRQAFTSSPQIQTQNEVPSALPDYNVKVPMAYQKAGVLNLPFDFKAHCYKLANGQRVVILPKEGETVVKTYVSTGSMNEPDKVRGISHYIEHNLFNGSNGLEAGEFFDTVNKMGAETNASTGFAETNYYISSNLLDDTDLEKKIKIHASMLETPRFALEMLEKEKGIVNSEINMILGDPENIAANETLKKLYNIKSTSGDLIGGSTQNITALTKEDVLDYYNNNYYPANMVTVVTGEVNPDETIKLIAKYFSAPNKVSHSRKFEELIPVNKTVRQDLISDKTAATHIMLGFNGPKNNDVKSRVLMNAIEELLTAGTIGRFSKSLKDYNAYASFNCEKVGSRPADNQAILISTETSEENSEKVLKTLFEQINSIVTNPPGDEDLKLIKKTLLNGYSHAFEVSHSINDIIGSNLLTGTPEMFTDYKKIVNSITQEDIVNAAKEFLNLNKTVVTVLHPQTANKDSIVNRYKNAVSFSGNVQKQVINPENVKRYIMPNNFEIITNDTKTDNSACEIVYNTDQFAKTKPAAIPLLSALLNEGSKFRNDVDFADDMHKNGINIYFSCDDSEIVANAEFSADDMQKALSSLKEVLLNPRFNEDVLNHLKSELKEKLEIREKNVNNKLYKELFKNLPIGYTKEDILNSIDDVTVEDLKSLYSFILNSAQGHLTVSAPFKTRPELLNAVFNETAALAPVKPAGSFKRDIYEPVTETKVLVDTHDKNQAQIVEAYKFKINGNVKDYTTVSLLNIILGGNASSRLFNDLREKQQLAYRVNSKVNYNDNTGVIKLQIGTTTENKDTNEISYDNVQKAINGFNKHIERIKTEKVSNEELESAKKYLKNTLINNAETTSGKNEVLSYCSLRFHSALSDNEALKIIDGITPDDIYNAANYIFSGKPTYSVLATENTIKANQDFFKTLA